MADEAVKERIRAASDIVEVIGRCFPLRKAGANYVALCPFHKEKTPSFQVSPSRQMFYCFGCRKGGDVFTFLQEYEKLTFPEALERLARRAGIALEHGGGDPEARKGRERLLALHEELCAHWHLLLRERKEGEEGREYLRQRGLGPDAVERFRLGFAPRSWDATLEWGRSRGYKPVLLEQAGLAVRSQNREGIYDRFRGRLIFPVSDAQGRVIAFSGRLVAPEEHGGKYINSPETPLFHKGRTLYGLDQAHRAALEEGRMMVCEGQMDLIACHMAGIRNVVAPMGTALTGEHARILKRYVSQIVMILDSDAAGAEAVRRSFPDLAGYEFSVRVGTLPEGSDPDSFIRERGAEAFRDRILQAAEYPDFLLEHLIGRHGGDGQDAQRTILDEMGKVAQSIGREEFRHLLVQKTAIRLGLNPTLAVSQFRRRAAVAGHAARGREESGSPSMELPHRVEISLLERILWGNEERVDWIFERLEMEWIGHSLVRRVLEFRQECHLEGRAFTAGLLLDRIEDQPERDFVLGLVEGEREVPDWQRDAEDLLVALRNRYLDPRIARFGDDQLRRQSAAPGWEQEYLSLIRARQSRLEPLAES